VKSTLIHHYQAKWIIRLGLVFVLTIQYPVQSLFPQVVQDTLQQEMGIQEGDKKDTVDFNQDGFGPMLFKTTLSLILIIGLIGLAGYGFKRLMNRSKGAGSVPVRIIGSTIMGPKKSIYIVEVEGRRLLLGVTDVSISFLTELENISSDELAVQQSLDSNKGKSSGSKFMDYLDTFMNKRGKNE